MQAFELLLWSLPNEVRQDGWNCLQLFIVSPNLHCWTFFLTCLRETLKEQSWRAWFGLCFFEASPLHFHSFVLCSYLLGQTSCLYRVQLCLASLPCFSCTCSCMFNVIHDLDLLAYASRSRNEHLLVKIVDFFLEHSAWSNLDSQF